MKNASNIVRFKQFLEAQDKIINRNSWLKWSFKCLTQSEFYSFQVICSLHLISESLIVWPIQSASHEHVPWYISQLWCFTLSLLLNKGCIFRVFHMIITFTLSLVKVSTFLINALLNFSFPGEYGNQTEIIQVTILVWSFLRFLSQNYKFFHL